MTFDSEEQRNDILQLISWAVPKGLNFFEIEQINKETCRPLLKAIGEATISKPKKIKSVT